MDRGLYLILFAKISMLLRRHELQLPQKQFQPFHSFILSGTRRDKPSCELACHVRFDYNANGMEKRARVIGESKLCLMWIIGRIII